MIENITVGQIYGWLTTLIGIGGATIVIVNAVRKAIDKGFAPINEKIDKVDKNACMNYIVSVLDDIDKGNKLEGVARKRFYEQYEHYTKDLNGNTYIHDEFERLKKEGKL